MPLNLSHLNFLGLSFPICQMRSNTIVCEGFLWETNENASELRETLRKQKKLLVWDMDVLTRFLSSAG